MSETKEPLDRETALQLIEALEGHRTEMQRLQNALEQQMREMRRGQQRAQAV